MASKYTTNYNLCQWEASDKVLRTEFNADNAKIDAALGSLASSVSGKASSSALNSLQNTVDNLKTSKADKSALDSLSQTVSQHTTSLAGKGNCQLYAATYTGSGLKGESNKNSLSFPKKPQAVLIVGPEGEQAILLQGQGVQYMGRFGVGGSPLFLTWTGNTLQWYSQSNASTQLNEAGKTYRVLALLQAG